MYEKQIFTVNTSENYKKALHAYRMKIDNQESAFNIYYLYLPEKQKCEATNAIFNFSLIKTIM